MKATQPQMHAYDFWEITTYLEGFSLCSQEVGSALEFDKK